jgi:hypothetical protein
MKKIASFEVAKKWTEMDIGNSLLWVGDEDYCLVFHGL